MYSRGHRIREMTIVGVVCGAVAFAAMIGSARAQEPPAAPSPPDPITLVAPDAVPFSSAELTQALLARSFASDEAPAPPVRVAPVGAGAVAVEVGSRSRVVALADRTGPAAARVVALVIAELLSDDRADREAESAAETASPVVNVAPAQSAPPPASLVAVPSPAAARSAPTPRLCLTGGLTRGTGAEELVAGTVDADVLLPIEYGGLRLAASLGLVYMPTRNAGTWREVSYSGTAARLLGGTSIGPVDLFAGPFASGYSIEGVNAHAGVLFGGEAVARLAAPLSRRVRLVAAARADVYGNRVRVMFADGGGYATPRVALSVGFGLAWDWAS